MSDLSAANCGCNDYNNGVSTASNNGGFSWIWILLILFFLNGNTFGRSGNGNGCGCGNGLSLFNNGGSCCEWLICILLLSSVCGGNSCNN